MLPEVSQAEIIARLSDSKWLADFISRYLSHLLKPILKRYYYLSEGGKYRPTEEFEDTEKTEHYPTKGICLIYAERTKPKQYGTPFPSWGERDDIYLSEFGDIATICFRDCEFTTSNSYIYDGDLIKRIETKMVIWTPEEVQQNKTRIAEALLAVARQS